MLSANASPAIRAVLLIVNPRSGRGRAARVAARLVDRLSAAGLEVHRIDLGTPEAARLTDAADASAGLAPGGDASAAVVVGGDGTMHSLAGLLARTGTPVYHVPTGTENLFARQFGMRAAAPAVLRALRGGRTTMVDLAECAPIPFGPPDTPDPSHPRAGTLEGDASERPRGAAAPRPFLIVGSVGFDAGVIHRLAAARHGAISRASYLAPIARELLTHRAPELSIVVDGRPLVSESRGLALIANSRQYAMRLDPAHRADMNDGLLDLVFFPARRLAALTGWAVLARLRLHHRHGAIVLARGGDIRIQAADGRAVLQLDGEAVGDREATQGAWRFGIRSGALRVLA